MVTRYYPTQLETFRQCPLKYKYGKDPEIRDRYRQPTPQLYVGTCVHDALEVFFDVTRTPMSERTEAKLDHLLRRAWAGADLWPQKKKQRLEERAKIFGDNKELEASWGRHALNMLHRYFLVADLTAMPFTAEQFHEAKLKSGIVVAGKIDRIDRLEDGSMRIMDYKTGKPPLRKDDAAVAADDLQLSTYAIVVRKKYRAPVSRCSLIFVAHDAEVGFTPTDELLAGKANLIEETVRAIEAETEFAPRENQFCPWCEYRAICPVGQNIAAADATRAEDLDVPF
jgi:putative RecB family exonuclease